MLINVLNKAINDGINAIKEELDVRRSMNSLSVVACNACGSNCGIWICL
jgi:hypothetical protein